VYQTTAYQIYPIGDQGITLDYGGEMNESVNKKINQLYRLLQDWHTDGVLDIIPAYRSISVIYDLFKIKRLAGTHSAFEYIEMKLRLTEAQVPDETEALISRKIAVPVCYDQSLAPDLIELAESHNMMIEELIEIHLQKSYRVYMIGFLPGFAYMGRIDERIMSPRKASPRIQVPAGSVGIASDQTGIYPFDSPGGWQLIGQTPLRLFDASKKSPTLFEPGDEVKFYKIGLEEFYHLKKIRDHGVTHY